MAKKTRKQKRLRGGKLVQKGSQGCIYYPALRCSGSPQRNPNVLSKLTYRENGIHEMGFRTILEPIDPTQKYFLYPLRMCDVRPEDLDPVENSLEPCDLIPKRFSKNLSDAVSLEYAYGGIDLIDIRLGYEDYVPMLSAFEGLLEGLVLLHQNNIAHLDIKPENVVALKKEDGSFQMRFIDFGFMTPFSAYNTRNPPLPLQQLGYWPLEFLFLDSRFKYEYINQKLIDRFKKDIAPSIEYGLPSPSPLLNITVKEVQDLWDKAQSYTRDEQLSRIMKATDIYSMGILLARYFYSITGRKQVNGKVVFQTTRTPHPSDPFWQWNQHVSTEIFYPLFELIWDMTLVDFENRPSAEDVLYQYRRIIPNIQESFQPVFLQQYLFQ